MALKLILAVYALLALALVAFTFGYNLPVWCDHPERSGNNLVQPFCKE